MRAVLLFLILSFLLSCKKTVTKDVYYVKYEVESSTIYYGGKLNVQLNNENGSLPLVINQRENWTTTIGPVNKGFNASVTATKQGWDGIAAENHLTIHLRIHVSKNNGPFALKQLNGTDSTRATASTSYVVE